ncbi:uncharacterized protein O9250_006673 [Rhynochetos jubatus]
MESTAAARVTPRAPALLLESTRDIFLMVLSCPGQGQGPAQALGHSQHKDSGTVTGSPRPGTHTHPPFSSRTLISSRASPSGRPSPPRSRCAGWYPWGERGIRRETAPEPWLCRRLVCGVAAPSLPRDRHSGTGRVAAASRHIPRRRLSLPHGLATVSRCTFVHVGFARRLCAHPARVTPGGGTGRAPERQPPPRAPLKALGRDPAGRVLGSRCLRRGGTLLPPPSCSRTSLPPPPFFVGAPSPALTVLQAPREPVHAIPWAPLLTCSRPGRRCCGGSGPPSPPHPNPGPAPPAAASRCRAASAPAPQILPVLLLLLLLLACPRSSVAGLGVTARTLSPCYSADLRPASESLVSAVGCTVLLTIPPLKAGRGVSWEYKTGRQEGVIVDYGFDRPANTSRPFENRTRFNETDFSLQIVLQRGDDRLYRFRSELEATDWFQLRVVEPLSEPEIVGNSSVKAGGNTKLVCKVLEGKADLYWWKKNGELLLGSDRIQFVDNATLCILKASMNDSGYYACVVRNEVSQNETSFLLHVQNAANVVLPVILTCVTVGSLAGVFVWCRRRDRPCHRGCR